MADGDVPYRDFRIEYPPGSLPAFLLPSLVSRAEGDPVYEPELNDAARGYARGFAALMTALLAATVVLTAVVARRARGDVRPRRGGARARRRDAAPARRARADAVRRAPRCADGGVRRRAPPRPRRGSPALALGLAIAAKLYPLLLAAARRDLRVSGAGGRAARRARRSASRPRRVAVVVLPFVALAPGEAWFSIRAQLTRGVQVESLPGSVVLALGRRRGQGSGSARSESASPRAGRATCGAPT